MIRLGRARLFQAKWTNQILDETFAAIRTQRPDIDPAKLDEVRSRMIRGIRDCLVLGYEDLIESVKGIPDPDDRHVVAAAIKSHAHVIVTYNLKDFPDAAHKKFGMEAVHPDDFVLSQIDLDEDAVLDVLQQLSENWRGNPSIPQVLEQLETEFPKTVAALRGRDDRQVRRLAGALKARAKSGYEGFRGTREHRGS
nr:PIN domain-containing protein [Actinopolymorpha pittospori]